MKSNLMGICIFLFFVIKLHDIFRTESHSLICLGRANPNRPSKLMLDLFSSWLPSNTPPPPHTHTHKNRLVKIPNIYFAASLFCSRSVHFATYKRTGPLSKTYCTRPVLQWEPTVVQNFWFNEENGATINTSIVLFKMEKCYPKIYSIYTKKAWFWTDQGLTPQLRWQSR